MWGLSWMHWDHVPSLWGLHGTPVHAYYSGTSQECTLEVVFHTKVSMKWYTYSCASFIVFYADVPPSLPSSPGNLSGSIHTLVFSDTNTSFVNVTWAHESDGDTSHYMVQIGSHPPFDVPAHRRTVHQVMEASGETFEGKHMVSIMAVDRCGRSSNPSTAPLVRVTGCPETCSKPSTERSYHSTERISKGRMWFSLSCRIPVVCWVALHHVVTYSLTSCHVSLILETLWHHSICYLQVTVSLTVLYSWWYSCALQPLGILYSVMYMHSIMSVAIVRIDNYRWPAPPLWLVERIELQGQVAAPSSYGS